MVRAPFQSALCAQPARTRSAQPAAGPPVREPEAVRGCRRSCRPGRVLSGASTRAHTNRTSIDVITPGSAPTPLAGTGPPSLVSGGHGRRPFRYIAHVERAIRQKVTIAVQPAGWLEVFRCAMSAQKLAASRNCFWQDSRWRARGAKREKNRVARLSPHYARLLHGRETRPPRPITMLAATARSPASPDPRACCFQLAALAGPIGA